MSVKTKIFLGALNKTKDFVKAVKITNHLLNKKFSRVIGEFSIKPSSVLVGKSLDDDVLVSFVLTGNKMDAQHQKLSVPLLHSILGEILSGKPIYGTVEHAGLKNEVDPLLKQPILKLVDAKLVNNDLYATAKVLEHPYKKQILNAITKGVLNGVSIELLVDSKDYDSQTLNNASIVGFSLVKQPAYENGKIYKISFGGENEQKA